MFQFLSKTEKKQYSWWFQDLNAFSVRDSEKYSKRIVSQQFWMTRSCTYQHKFSITFENNNLILPVKIHMYT